MKEVDIASVTCDGNLSEIFRVENKNEEKQEIYLTKNKTTGEYRYYVNIGGIVKYFKLESSADRYLRSLGYAFELDGENSGLYIKKYFSSDEIKLKKDFDSYIIQ